jgi:hypothetical protein
MSRHFNVEDLSVGESDDEENVKRSQQDRRDAEKVASPKYPMHAASGTLATSRLGPGCDTRAYIWPRSWQKPETLSAPWKGAITQWEIDPPGNCRSSR